MEWVETTAKSVDEAKELALDRLGVDERDAEFEVLEEPRPGLFGRMRGEARVRARVRPVQPRPKAERRDRRRSGRGGGSDRRPNGSPAGDAGSEDAPAEDDGSASPPARAGRSNGSRRGRGGRGRSGNRSPQPAEAASTQGDTTATAAADDGQEPTMSDDVTVHEQAAMVQEFVEGLVDAFGYEGAEVGTTTIDDDTVEVHVDGSDLGLLVGPRGATLQAIHDLSRTVVQRRATGHHEGRVRLDVAGYREKRREALVRFTEKVAAQVKETGTAQVLEPMSSADRKVVHDTANEIDGVVTTSEGEDPRRRVVIQPG